MPATQVAEAETSTPTGPDINSINDVSTEVDPVVEKPSSDDRDNSDQEVSVRMATAASGRASESFKVPPNTNFV